MDRHLARVIRKVGSFPTKKQKPQHPFESLLRAIVYQQLAGKAAATIFGRVKALAWMANCLSPEEILRAVPHEGEFQSAAPLSRQKIAAVKIQPGRKPRRTVPAGRDSPDELMFWKFWSAHAGALDSYGPAVYTFRCFSWVGSDVPIHDHS